MVGSPSHSEDGLSLGSSNSEKIDRTVTSPRQQVGAGATETARVGVPGTIDTRQKKTDIPRKRSVGFDQDSSFIQVNIRQDNPVASRKQSGGIEQDSGLKGDKRQEHLAGRWKQIIGIESDSILPDDDAKRGNPATLRKQFAGNEQGSSRHSSKERQADPAALTQELMGSGQGFSPPKDDIRQRKSVSMVRQVSSGEAQLAVFTPSDKEPNASMSLVKDSTSHDNLNLDAITQQLLGSESDSSLTKVNTRQTSPVASTQQIANDEAVPVAVAQPVAGDQQDSRSPKPKIRSERLENPGDQKDSRSPKPKIRTERLENPGTSAGPLLSIEQDASLLKIDPKPENPQALAKYIADDEEDSAEFAKQRIDGEQESSLIKALPGQEGSHVRYLPKILLQAEGENVWRVSIPFFKSKSMNDADHEKKCPAIFGSLVRGTEEGDWVRIEKVPPAMAMYDDCHDMNMTLWPTGFDDDAIPEEATGIGGRRFGTDAKDFAGIWCGCWALAWSCVVPCGANSWTECWCSLPVTGCCCFPVFFTQNKRNHFEWIGHCEYRLDQANPETAIDKHTVRLIDANTRKLDQPQENICESWTTFYRFPNVCFRPRD